MPSQAAANSTPGGPVSTSYRRHNFLISKDFQFRMTGRFVSVLLGSVLVSHLITLGFLKIREWLNPASQNIMYVASSLPDKLAFAKLLELVWQPMLASMLIGLVCISVFGIFYSHRMAGPIFNLKRRLQELEKGDLNLSMHIRRTDEFHDVEDAFNQMISQLRLRLQKLEQDILNASDGDKTKIQALFQELYGHSSKR